VTFLEIAVRTRQEVGGSGTGPSTVTNQTGELGRIVSWAATADEDVQRVCNNWLFMNGSFTVNTVASDGSYTATDCSITDLREWLIGTFKIYLSSSGVSGETELFYIDYETWYQLYNTGAQTDGVPIHFTIAPDQSIKLGPKPNDIYVLSGEYQKSVTTMTDNDDTPVYPPEFHMAAVYRAMMKYGRYTAASEIYQDGEKEYKRMIREMARSQLPKIKLGGPLA